MGSAMCLSVHPLPIYDLKDLTLPLVSPFYSCIALLFSEDRSTYEMNEKSYLIWWKQNIY